MKKSLLLGIAAVAAISFSSCLKSEDDHYTNTSDIPAYNLFTPVSGEGTPFVGTAIYRYIVEWPAGTIKVQTNNMSLPGGTTGYFNTIPMLYENKYVTVDNINREVNTFTSKTPTESGMEISNLTGMVTQAVPFPPYSKDEDITPGYVWYVPVQNAFFVFMQYQYGSSWNVRTFWPDMTYAGATEASYSPAAPPFVTDGIQYRIIMQRKENAITDKADLIIYNARFVPQMDPLASIIVKDLDLEFTADGYTVSGKNNVPYLVEDGELQEYPSRIFNDFEAKVSGDLTEISMNYTVAGVFKGTFQGSCLLK